MTHINAYIQEVESKRVALAAAQAEYDNAVAALDGKEIECGLREPATEPDESVEPAQSKPKGKKVEYR